MSFLKTKTENGGVFFDETQAVDAAKSISAAYQSANPFPHTVIDNFIAPEILEKALADFPADIIGEQKRSQELYKGARTPDELHGAFARNLFYSFNARPFLRFLEELTGIEGLIPVRIF